MNSVGLDSRLERARGHYRACRLCEHRCGADRAAGERGPCKAGPVPGCTSTASSTARSGSWSRRTCSTSRAATCAVRSASPRIDAFDPRRGRPLTAEFLAEAVAQGRARGADAPVGRRRADDPPAGDPRGDGRLPRPAADRLEVGLPRHARGVRAARGVVDVYLADFKFGNDACAGGSRAWRITWRS